MTTPRDVGLDLRFSDEELEATREQIVDFIAEQVSVAGVDRAVIGLSGGIDSTLTAHLAVEALGPDAVHGLIMPSESNREENMTDAERVARTLSIGYDVIEIEPVVEAYLEAYPEELSEERIESESLRTAVGNVGVRTRAVFAYFVANHGDGLVLGTGNRTEALVGYFTKYGDGAVDCHPIGDLYKQQVRQLARLIGVSEDIVTKTPTAGLWTGQTDEEELGLSYDALDAVLALSVDGPLSVSATARQLSGVAEADIEHVHDLHARSEHKRLLPPSPGPVQ